MLRPIIIAAAAVLLSTAAFAQNIQPKKTTWYIGQCRLQVKEEQKFCYPNVRHDEYRGTLHSIAFADSNAHIITFVGHATDNKDVDLDLSLNTVIVDEGNRKISHKLERGACFRLRNSEGHRVGCAAELKESKALIDAMMVVFETCIDTKTKKCLGRKSSPF